MAGSVDAAAAAGAAGGDALASDAAAAIAARGPGTKAGKMRALRLVRDAAGGSLAALAMPALADEDIEVRGEAFSTLVASAADIAGDIAPFLASPDKTVRAHSALVLANRGDARLAGRVALLAADASAAVRAAAMGSLGHMAVRSARLPLPGAGPGAPAAVRACLFDASLEVRRSALQAASDMGLELSESEAGALAAAGDAEIDRLLAGARGGRPA